VCSTNSRSLPSMNLATIFAPTILKRGTNQQTVAAGASHTFVDSLRSKLTTRCSRFYHHKYIPFASRQLFG
jgi:hypothetical protein